jgi:neurofibromin 1
MSNQKPIEWIAALLERFQNQQPIKVGELTKSMKSNTEQKKECLINLSKYKFSLVINGLIDILRSIEATRISDPEYGPINLYDSYLDVLDTLERCLTSQPRDPGTSRLDEAIYVNKLLPILSKLVNLPAEINFIASVTLVRQLASRIIFALSVNNFNALFGRVLSRLEDIASDDYQQSSSGSGGSGGTDNNPLITYDLELIQHINFDLSKLTRLINELVLKWRYLKCKSHQMLLVSLLKQAIWNWLDTYPDEFRNLQKK